MYVLGNPSTPKNPRDNEANPLDAIIAALSSITCPRCIPPYMFITALNGPFPGGKKSVPRMRPSCLD